MHPVFDHECLSRGVIRMPNSIKTFVKIGEGDKSGEEDKRGER